MPIKISTRKRISKSKILALYAALDWSAAKKPELLYKALLNSDQLISAWDGEKLVGLGNAITDGYLVVYYPHMLIHPDYQGKGVGSKILSRLQIKYKKFHMQILVADGRAIDFYSKNGFEKAGDTQAMWIYEGTEH